MDYITQYRYIKFLSMSVLIISVPSLLVPAIDIFYENRLPAFAFVSHTYQLLLNYVYTAQFVILSYLLKSRFESLNNFLS